MKSNKNYIDRLIHPDLASDRDLFQRAKILATANVAMVAMLLFGITAALIGPSTQDTVNFGVPLVLGTVLLLIGNLVLLAKGGKYQLSANLTIAIPFIVVAASTCITGGPSQSPVIHLWCVPAITSFYLLGWSNAIRMNIAFALMIIAITAAQILGVSFLQTIRPEQFSLVNRLIFFIGMICTGSVAAMYELTSSALKRQRDQEHMRAVELANNDLLTGIANRRRFEDELDASVRNSVVNPYFSLCVIDLNDFKPINDTHGHHVGDEVIRVVAARIRDEIRKVDFVARLGGDEFVLIIRNIENHQSDPTPLLQRVLKRIEEPIATSVGELHVSGSIGMALYPQHGADAVALLQAADTAMYDAKSARLGISHYRAQIQ